MVWFKMDIIPIKFKEKEIMMLIQTLNEVKGRKRLKNKIKKQYKENRKLPFLLRVKEEVKD